MDRRYFLNTGTITATLFTLAAFALTSATNAQDSVVKDKVPFEQGVKMDTEWQKTLTPGQYRITLKASTEAPFTSPLTDLKAKGVSTCVCCDLPLFSCEDKFDSGTGWPGFYAPIDKFNLLEKVENSLFGTRAEVWCNRCDSGRDRVFDDGPPPAARRYRMSGAALLFIKDREKN